MTMDELEKDGWKFCMASMNAKHVDGINYATVSKYGATPTNIRF